MLQYLLDRPWRPDHRAHCNGRRPHCRRGFRKHILVQDHYHTRMWKRVKCAGDVVDSGGKLQGTKI